MAQKRVALVIGNSAYVHAPSLATAAGDAEAIGAALEELGFETERALNAGMADMQRAVSAFTQAAAQADLAFVYFSGLGMQVDGINHLLPVNAEPRDKIDLEFQSLRVDDLLSVLRAPGRNVILLIDASRPNALAEGLARALGSLSRSVGRGLAAIPARPGVHIALSAQPGETASDAAGEHSPFAAALLALLQRPGLTVGDLMTGLREDVRKATGESQIPWTSAPAGGSGVELRKARVQTVALVDTVARPQTVTDLPKLPAEIGAGVEGKAIERAFWQALEDSDSIAMFARYLEQFPDGEFSALARIKIQMLRDARRAAGIEDPEDELRLARLAQPEVEEIELPPEPEPEIEVLEGKELARAMQEELNRLGCSAGAVDGIWGKGSRRALAAFAKESGVELAGEEPSMEALLAMRALSETVCQSAERTATRAKPRDEAPARTDETPQRPRLPANLTEGR
jgi:hypothetical protein